MLWTTNALWNTVSFTASKEDFKIRSLHSAAKTNICSLVIYVQTHFGHTSICCQIMAPSSGLIVISFAVESSSSRLWVLIKPSGNFTRAVKHAESFSASRHWAFQRIEPQARLLPHRKNMGPSIPPSNERMWLRLLGHAADFSFVSEWCVKTLLSYRGECGLEKISGCHRDNKKYPRAGKKNVIPSLHFKSNHENMFDGFCLFYQFQVCSYLFNVNILLSLNPVSNHLLHS